MIMKSFYDEADYVVTHLSYEYLNKIMNAIKAMSLSKEGFERISLAWGKNAPAILGTFSEKTNHISGFAIAPRIVGDN